MSKLIDQLYCKVLKVCSNNELIEDKIKEIFASEKCCALTTKGVLCTHVSKEAGFCGLHSSRKDAAVECSFVRTDGSKCSIKTSYGDRCWIHKDKVSPKKTLRPEPARRTPRKGVFKYSPLKDRKTSPTASSAASTPVTSPAASTPVTSPAASTPVTSPAASTPTTSPATTTPTTSPATTTPTTSPATTTPVTSSVGSTPTSPATTTPTTSPATTTPVTSSVGSTPTTSPATTTPTTSPATTTPVTSSVGSTPTTSPKTISNPTASAPTTPTTSPATTTPTTSPATTTPVTSPGTSPATSAPKPATHKRHTSSIEIKGTVEYPKVRKADTCPAVKNKGKKNESVCGADLKGKDLTCGHHKKYELTRQLVEARAAFTHTGLVELYEKKFKTYSGQTRGLMEEDIKGDLDEVIDEENAAPRFRPSTCLAVLNSGSFCGNPVTVDKKGRRVTFCEPHRGSLKLVPHNSGVSNTKDPYCEVMRPYLEPMEGVCVPNFHSFSRLKLFAHATKKGPVVIGKSWCDGFFAETLKTCKVSRNLNYSKDEEGERIGAGENDEQREKMQRAHNGLYLNSHDPIEPEGEGDLIRRCHNNGLLYKILPQSIVHKQWTISPDLDPLPGRGFTSFEQMIVERPALYIKYWNVWLGHIRRAKDFTRYMSCSVETLRRILNSDEPVDWQKYCTEVGPKIGLYHVEVPAPTLPEVEKPDFNPFKYCRDWVLQNAPDKIDEPWFPPMYLLYPFPLEYCEDSAYVSIRPYIEDIKKEKRNLYLHYNMNGKIRGTTSSWMQWLKYGDHEGDIYTLYRRRTLPSVDIVPKEIERAAEDVIQGFYKLKEKYSGKKD